MARLLSVSEFPNLTGVPSDDILEATMYLSNNEILESASMGDVLGTVSISAAYVGSPVWSLIQDGSGQFTINASTGVVSVDSALTPGVTSIKVKVKGTTPPVKSATFPITINAVAGYQGPLDLVSGSVAAFGQRALSSAKRGSATYIVRRSSDDTTQSVSSDAVTGAVNPADVVSFIGGGDGFIAEWCDQSATGINAENENAFQPKWDAGVAGTIPGVLFVTFDSTYLYTEPSPYFAGAVTFFAVVKYPADGLGVPSLFGVNGDDGDHVFVGIEAVPSHRVVYHMADMSDNVAGGTFTPPMWGALQVLDGAFHFGSKSLKVNGTALVSSGDSDTGGALDNIPASQAFSSLGIGQCDQGSSWNGHILEIIIYPSILSDADRTLIRQNMASYYDIALS